MKLDQLPKLTTRSKKRMGRGLGSGKGKTGGKGMKGQKARGKIPAWFTGGGLTLYRKLPYVRGFTRHGGNPPRNPDPIIIKTEKLNGLKANSIVNLATLIENRLVKEKEAQKKGVKILGSAELKVALTLAVPASKSAVLSIEKAGGKVVS